jgi:AcrR family transcriptional regulator
MCKEMVMEEIRDARQRVLDVAEHLFMERGYNAISLRDIADALGIKQASLYYHFPDGKEQLYLGVTEKVFSRHREGVCQALAMTDGNLRSQLHAVADWFASQPPMCLMGMVHADLPALTPEHTTHLERVAYEAVFQPLAETFAAAEARGEMRPHNPHLLAGSFLALMDGLTIGQSRQNAPPRWVISGEIVDILLDGLLPRPGVEGQ